MLFNKLNLFKACPIILWITCIFLFSRTASAQCTSQVGKLKVLNYQHGDGIFICYNDTLKVEIESYELADSQQLYYVYHDKKNVFDGTIIEVDTIKTYDFVNNDFSPDTLYITAIASKAKSFNWLEDSCAVFSKTVTAIFLSKIAGGSKIDCNADNEHCVDLQITGGLPKLNNTYNYMISGYISDTLAINEIGKYKLNLSPHDRIKLYISDDNGCKDTLSKYVNACSLMPIDLISFDAEIVNDGHLLEWVMAAQINVDHFLLEVSKNAGPFEVIDTIAGAGTTSQAKGYQFLNQNLTPGVYQYKISTVSNRGIIWELAKVKLTNYATILHPNPVQSELHFRFKQSWPTLTSLNILDLSGGILQIDDMQIKKNPDGFSIDVSKLPSSIYFLQIQGDDFNSIEKFMVIK